MLAREAVRDNLKEMNVSWSRGFMKETQLEISWKEKDVGEGDGEADGRSKFSTLRDPSQACASALSFLLAFTGIMALYFYC